MRDSLLGVEPGQVIAERYRIEALIGRGAMGAVWRAAHLRLNSPVAIKFLNPAIADDPEMLERFMREAQSAALVRSTHVVQIFDYGVERGAPYIAMELLVGESLEHRLLSRGVITASELDKVFGEVARAVAVAHEVGVIHRDLKPGNVFIAREGGHEVTKVLDFGIAKLLDQQLSSPTGKGTHTGIMLGTPHYMSPEQARGNRRIDHRTDLWALAVLAFECLTGKQPFEGEALGDLMVNICTSDPRLPSSCARVPSGFDAWFLEGVMKDPEARFANAREMAEALHVLLADAARELQASSSDASFGTGRTLGFGAQPGPDPGVKEVDRVGETRPRGSLTTHGASSTEVRASSSVAAAGSARGKRVPIVLALAGAGVAAWSLLGLREPAPVAAPAQSSAALGPAPQVAAEPEKLKLEPAEPMLPEPLPAEKPAEPRKAAPKRPVTRAALPVFPPPTPVQQNPAAGKGASVPKTPPPPPRDPFSDRL